MSVFVRNRKIPQVFSRENGRQTWFAILCSNAFTPVIYRLAPLSGKDYFSLFNRLIPVPEN